MKTELIIDLGKGVSGWLDREQVRERMQHALADWMDVDEFLGQIHVALQKPNLQHCTQRSLYEAAHTCAVLQLLPTLQQVALVPRGKECTVTPQWQGYQALMTRHPDVLDIRGNLVAVVDSYTFQDEIFTHDYDPFASERTLESLKDIRGGYLRIIYRDRRPDKYFFVPVSYIAKCRECAQTKNVWDKWFEQMALKTVYRAGYSRRVVPVDPLVAKKLEEVNAIEDALLGNDPSRIASASSNGKRISRSTMLDAPRIAAPEDEPDAIPNDDTPLEAFKSDLARCEAQSDGDEMLDSFKEEQPDLAENAEKVHAEWVAEKFSK